MAVRINPCFGCPLREGCEQRKVFSKRAAGLGLRSATFNCDILAEKLAVGARVVVKMPEFGSDEHDNYYKQSYREVKATIHTSNVVSFACVVDKADIEAMAADGVLRDDADPDRIRYRKMLRHSRIVRFLDEPRWNRCEHFTVVSPSGECTSRDCVCAQLKVERGKVEAIA